MADHCRIGSLEMPRLVLCDVVVDHCRIGSLETLSALILVIVLRSLPHRQLRKRIPDIQTFRH